MREGDPALEELIAELERASERLDELIMETLTEAVQRGERARPVRERQLTRARHALERAAHILRVSAAGGAPSDEVDDDAVD